MKSCGNSVPLRFCCSEVWNLLFLVVCDSRIVTFSPGLRGWILFPSPVRAWEGRKGCGTPLSRVWCPHEVSQWDLLTSWVSFDPSYFICLVSRCPMVFCTLKCLKQLQQLLPDVVSAWNRSKFEHNFGTHIKVVSPWCSARRWVTFYEDRGVSTMITRGLEKPWRFHQHLVVS